MYVAKSFLLFLCFSPPQKLPVPLLKLKTLHTAFAWWLACLHHCQLLQFLLYILA